MRKEREEKGDKVVKMEVYESDRDFLTDYGIFNIARDNLHIILDNIRKGYKVDNVAELFNRNIILFTKCF